MNGGTCIDGVDDFTCSCPAGLTGLLCECLILDVDDQNDENPGTTNANPGDDDTPTTRWPNLNCNYTRNDLTTTASTMDQTGTTEQTTPQPTTMMTIGGNYDQTTATSIVDQTGGAGPEAGPTAVTAVDNGDDTMMTTTTRTTATLPITSIGSGLSTGHNNAFSTTTDAVATTRTQDTGVITTTTTINSTPITITTSDLDTTTTPSGGIPGPDQVVTITTDSSTSTSTAAATSETLPGVGDYGSESDKFTTILFPVETSTGAGTKDGVTSSEAAAIKTTTERGETTTTDATTAEVAITEPSIIVGQTTTTIQDTTEKRTDWETTLAQGGRTTTSRTTMETMPQTGYPHPEFFTDSPQLSSDTTTMTVTTEATPTTRTTTTEQSPPFDGTITNFTLGLDCKRMPCLNGGTCVMTSGGAQVSKSGN